LEHRWNKRYPVTTDVTIHHHAHPLVHGKTHDIGPTGLFIEGVPVVYRRNTMLDIEFLAQDSHHQRPPQRHRLPAIVIHSSDEGMGLMFRETTAEALEAWQLFCRGASVIRKTEATWA